MSRLARYNVTAEALSAGGAKVKYFEGAPIPTSVLLTALMTVAALTGHLGPDLWLGDVLLGPMHLHPLALAYAVLGGLMISKTIHLPKLRRRPSAPQAG